GKSYNTMILGQHRLGFVEVDLSIGSQRNSIDLKTGKLPRDYVAVMLELREEHAVPPVLRQRTRNQVDRFGRAAGEDQFIRLAADEVGRCGSRGFVTRGHRSRALVNAAINGRVIGR